MLMRPSSVNACSHSRERRYNKGEVGCDVTCVAKSCPAKTACGLVPRVEKTLPGTAAVTARSVPSTTELALMKNGYGSSYQSPHEEMNVAPSLSSETCAHAWFLKFFFCNVGETRRMHSSEVVALLVAESVCVCVSCIAKTLLQR
jgi:hypothetical protein